MKEQNHMQVLHGIKRLWKSTNSWSIMKREQKSVNVLENEGLAQLSSIRFCSLHDLPLRGKTDKQTVFNDLLSFQEESGDLILAGNLKNAPQNATSMSDRVQNEELKSMQQFKDMILLKTSRVMIYSQFWPMRLWTLQEQSCCHWE